MSGGSSLQCLSFLLLLLEARTARIPHNRYGLAFLDLHGHRQICIYSFRDARSSSLSWFNFSQLKPGHRPEMLFHLPWCKGPSRVLGDILSCSSRCAWGAEPGQDLCSSNFRLSFKDLWCIPILLQLRVIKFISKSSPGEHITIIVPTIIILKAAELQGLNSESFPHQNYMKTWFFF